MCKLDCMEIDMTGIVLAGGKSSRMDEDKSFVLFSGRPLIEILIDKISPIFKDLIIVTNNPRRYEKYGIRIETDLVKDRGPLAGIYTGLVSSKDNCNFICACDMPFLSQGLIQYMLKERDGYDVVIPEYEGRLQPLCAIYSKECVAPIENELSKNNLKIIDFFKHVKVRRIDEKEISRFISGQPPFVNINTPQDLHICRNKFTL